MIPMSVKQALGNELAGVLEKIFEDAPDGIVAIDDNHAHNVMMYNAATARMFGYENGEAVGKPFSSMVSTDSLEEPATFSTPSETHVVVGKRKCGENFPCEVKLSKTQVGKHILCIATLRDVSSEVKQAKSVEDGSAALKSYRAKKKAELRDELRQIQRIGRVG